MEMKRQIKDSVFTHLFSIAKYRKELYLSLHPEDVDVTDEDIQPKTIENVFSAGLYNDLGMLIKEKLLILVEAQSIWSINILIRMILYLGESYKLIVTVNKMNIYGTKKVALPKPEFYVVYTGNEKLDIDEISLNKDFFDDESKFLDLKIKIINKKNSENFVQKGTKCAILNEYIEFSRTFDRNREKLKDKKIAVKETIDGCIHNNILKEYLTEHKEEIMSIMEVLYDQDYATECWKKELQDDARAEGKVEGKAEGFVELVKDKLIDIEVAAKKLNMSKEEFSKLL